MRMDDEIKEYLLLVSICCVVVFTILYFSHGGSCAGIMDWCK